MKKQDITTEEDIIELVNTFYEKIRVDDTLGPIFNEKIKDWDTHLPTMYNFWDSLLLGNKKYSGRPFPKHMALPLNKGHFEKWLMIFYKTLDELFEGPKKEEAEMRAVNIANIFMSKMGLYEA